MLKTTKKNLSNLLILMEKEINAIIDKMMLAITVPNDPLGSIKNKKREELFKVLGGGEHWQRIPNGFKLIREDLVKHLLPNELNAQERELEHAMDNVKRFNHICSSAGELAEALADTPETFQTLFGITDQTIEHFYEAGCRYYKGAYYKEAADVFFLISFLNPHIFNVWLSLGLTEQQGHNYEKALEAFAMATLIDMRSIQPHIHSAECYIHLRDNIVAKATLELAFKTLQTYHSEQMAEDQQIIEKLMQQTA